MSERDAAQVFREYMDDVNAPDAESEFRRPLPVSNTAGLFQHDPESAGLLTRIEMALLEYCQNGRLSQRHGQAILDMLRHPQFDPNESAAPIL